MVRRYPWVMAINTAVVSPLVLFCVATPVGATPYTPLDRIGRWVIERRQVSGGGHLCRAQIPAGGAWFSANVHLDANGTLVVPPGVVHQANPDQLAAVREALQRCRTDLLYLPPN